VSLDSCVHAVLWGCLKAQVYQPRPQILEGLKEAITQEVAAIAPEMTPQGHGKVPGEAQSVYRN
jgi:hypothetical protein